MGTHLLDGLIVKEQSGFFWVEITNNSETDTPAIYTCRLRGRLMEEAQSSDIAAIGDQVRIQPMDDGTGTIEKVLPRKSALSRAVRTEGSRGAGQSEREQVIVANADQALFVFAAADPAPSLKLVDRFLVAGEKSGVERLILVINKIDLANIWQIMEQFAPYSKMGYPILYTSALFHMGIQELRQLLNNRISVFTGPSGVGKSSLLNTLQPGLGRAVKEVSRAKKEGLHTTRDSQLVKLDSGGYLADTPGLRSLTIWDVEPEELDAYYVDIAPYIPACRFADCTHHNEPGCAVRKAADDGAISRSRYLSYVNLRDELEEAYAL